MEKNSKYLSLYHLPFFVSHCRFLSLASPRLASHFKNSLIAKDATSIPASATRCSVRRLARWASPHTSKNFLPTAVSSSTLLVTNTIFIIVTSWVAKLTARRRVMIAIRFASGNSSSSKKSSSSKSSSSSASSSFFSPPSRSPRGAPTSCSPLFGLEAARGDTLELELCKGARVDRIAKER